MTWGMIIFVVGAIGVAWLSEKQHVKAWEEYKRRKQERAHLGEG